MSIKLKDANLGDKMVVWEYRISYESENIIDGFHLIKPREVEIEYKPKSGLHFKLAYTGAGSQPGYWGYSKIKPGDGDYLSTINIYRSESECKKDYLYEIGLYKASISRYKDKIKMIENKIGDV